MIEQYDTFKKKGFTSELIFGGFNDQPILSDFYNLLNDDNDDGNNVSGIPVDYDLPDNEGAEYLAIPNDEDIIDEKIIDDD